ncbi:MAG: bifunctional demethylmenaquinone methyltransferase/2-methoxy-6-polyprenyl-1,4-benzoquinol methylase UbiE [Fimbriimonas sp.]
MSATKTEQPIWESEGAQKRRAVQRMFGEIAPSYDRLNAWMSFRLHHKWRELAVGVLNLKPGARVLDVCCGTGDFLLPLKQAVGATGLVFGVDFSGPMIAQVTPKTGCDVALGDACALPIASGSFDAVTVGWGIRNVPDIDQAHREIARVLRPGGRFVSLDMARPRQAVIGALSTWAFQNLVPKLGALFGSKDAYTYLPKSTERFSTREQLVESMEKAGFEDIHYRDLMMGNICMHWGVKR